MSSADRRLFFITHAEVVMDPDVPVPQWPLSERGRARHSHFARDPLLENVTRVFSSAEQKALDGAKITADVLNVQHHVIEALHENDRSATGYLPSDEFEAVADAFFAQPDVSVRGWEKARDAQSRILSALESVVAKAPVGDIAVIAHGGVGALFLCHLLGLEISRDQDQPGRGGGNVLTVALPDWTLLEGWRDIAPEVKA